MCNKATFFFLTFFFLSFSSQLISQQFKYDDNWGAMGLTVERSSNSSIRFNFSVSEFFLNDIEIDGKNFKTVHIPEVFLPNNAGAPNLPGTGRYIAVPKGAIVSLKIIDSRSEIYKDIEVAPSPVIPIESDDSPILYIKNPEIYSKDEFYPSKFVQLSEQTVIRGVDAAILGITPFQYNPVTKELVVYKDIKIEVEFQGSGGTFGEEKYRSRWWDPILRDLFVNQEMLPYVDHNKFLDGRLTGYEYLIITPDIPVYLSWADSIRQFRQEQGIKTGIVTLTQIGGNTSALIETYINNAYNTWDIPPAAILFLADYGTGSATSNGIIAAPFTYSTYTCISDHYYADVNGNQMPDIVTARMTAQNETHLNIMIKKFLDYERNPPTNPNFYNNPITAMGWQTERWFQLCSEVVNGFWKNTLGKNPVRENAIYSGTPSTTWSTATNTATVLNYFGPNGLNYIPQTPAHLTDWGGNATRVNNDINSGAFMLSHRDHGAVNRWGEPDYSITHMSGLNNNDLSFILSINCLTGKFNYSTEVFAEAFHRYPKRALGLIAATEVSYSFVNDTYLWGVFDYMWPQFMPAYGQPGPERIMPSFGNVAGKYFLEQSSWPYNTSNKQATYYLFHHHGDAFTTVYSEMPQHLTVAHDPILLSGLTTFNVTADIGSLMAITLNNEIISVATGTGAPVAMVIPLLTPGDYVRLTITKQNYYRYVTDLQVIPPTGAYIIHQDCIVNDSTIITEKLSAGNGLLDYNENAYLCVTLRNLGSQPTQNLVAKLRSSDPYISITDSVAVYGVIGADSVKQMWNSFAVTVSDNVPNNHPILFTVAATDGADEWYSTFTLKAYAPVLQYAGYTVNDSAGNNNGKIEPGETVVIIVKATNKGASPAYSVTGNLVPNNTYLTITSDAQSYGTIDSNQVVLGSFTAIADADAPAGQSVTLNFTMAANHGITAVESFNIIIGQIPALIVDMDKNHNSANVMLQSMQNLNVNALLLTEFPTELNLYSSMFVCLGTYSQNYKLTAADGQLLADYLNLGGMLYMEGGDTWFYDTKTVVHPMFKIQGIADGTGNLTTIVGQPGTMTEGMSFVFSGENNYIDQINAISPAVVMLRNNSPSYGTTVCYESGTYKTIGSSFEFGGLVNGTGVSVRDSLMKKMLQFFNVYGIVPVELASIEAEVVENKIQLTWVTATETNNMGFEIERSKDGEIFEAVGYVKGKGTTTQMNKYSFTDQTLTGSCLVYYRLRQIDYDGSFSYSSVVEVDYSALPTEFSLSQNYPNPFNPSTTIKFALPGQVRVSLIVYDALGSEVETIMNKEMDAGYHQIEWNASRYSSGVYIYRITAGDFTSVKKMMILK
jgi:hypothetical protein